MKVVVKQRGLARTHSNESMRNSIENSHYRVIVSYLLKDARWELPSATKNKNAFLTPYYAEHIRYEASNTGNFLGENKWIKLQSYKPKQNTKSSSFYFKERNSKRKPKQLLNKQKQ